MKKIVAGIVLTLMLTSVFISIGSAKLIVDGEGGFSCEPMHIPPEEITDAPIDLTLPSDSYVTGLSALSSSTPYYEVGDWAIWLLRDAYLGIYYLAYYQLRAIGTTAEIWVGPLGWATGDPRTTPVILDEQVEYVLEQFETNIYPTDTEYFGDPDFHDGNYSLLVEWGVLPEGYYYEETGRNVILVSNIRDQNWHDYGPPPYPYFIIGFYSSSVEAYTDRNVISIDGAYWEYLLGPPGTEWIPGIQVSPANAYAYEGTVAHEYQHLIHADRVPGDALYMNEGCSMYAEILCGYGVSWSHVNHFLYAPDNALTKWGDQGDINILADYGSATLWAVYLNDNYSPEGESFLHYYMEAGLPADQGINAALADLGYEETFEDVYYKWTLANYLDSVKDSPYTYESIDLNPETNPDVIAMNVHELKAKPMSFYGSDFGSTTTILGYDTGVVDLGPYSSDYMLFTDWKKDMMLYFDGGEATEVPYGWEMVGGMWYSGATNLVNTLLAGEVYVDAADPELEITTYWDIEDYWDFGFVQVSTDGGLTWTSLENDYTTYLHDPSAYYPIVANLPGLTSWSGFLDPDGWITMTFDLTAYGGMDVMLGFRYMTDWGTLYEGWYISDVEVGGTIIPLESFEKVAGYPSFFTVTVVHIEEDPYEPMGMKVKGIETVTIDHLYETGQILIKGQPDEHVLVIVSNPSDATEFEYGVADYEITIETT